MRKAKRRILFYSLAFVFIIMAPFALIYAIGYSLDIKTLSFVSTGGIFVKANQTGIRIFIDNKEQRSTSIFTSGALMTGLYPGTYAVRIEKDGFRPWERKIIVHRQVVSEYRNIFLLPQTTPLVSKNEVTRIGSFRYHISTNGTYMALLYDFGNTMTIERTSDHAILMRKTFASEFPFDSVEWITDTTLSFNGRRGGTERSVIVISDTGAVHETVIRIPKSGSYKAIKNVFSSPTDPLLFFVVAQDGDLTLYNSVQKTHTPVLSQVVYATVSDGTILFINTKGFFATADMAGKNITTIERPGFFLNGVFQSFRSPIGDVIILDGVGGVFFFEKSSQKIRPITGGIRSVSFDANGRVALLEGDVSITLLFLIPESDAPFRPALSRVPVVENIRESIKSSVVYGKRYVLFSTEKGIFGAEIGVNNGSIVSPISDRTGYLFTDNETVSIVNDKGTYVYAIE